MAVDHFRYDLLAQEALRGVVRRVLTEAAKDGLPGEHHFYVTFATGAPGVKISPRLAAQHPQEMTIVLQHQFWDLTVCEEAFEVGLSFTGIPERLIVPFAAIKGFFDPSVQFGLQFATDPSEASEPPASTAQVPARQVPLSAGQVPAAPRDQPLPGLPAASANQPERAPEGGAAGEGEPPASGGEIVRLDRFRKK
jgi:uncharacterized protein